MIQFEEWLASPFADDLISKLVERKAILQSQLERPDLGDNDCLTFVRMLQGQTAQIRHLSALVEDSRTMMEKRNGR